MEVTVPGDKSITQRALIFAALSGGESRLSGLLPGEDPRAAAHVLRALGARIPPLPADGGEIRVRGRGLRRLASPDGPLDCGNSGTAARLLLGVLAAQEMTVVVTGDVSLRGRPMRRVFDPLAAMGAEFEELEAAGRLPVRVKGGELRPLEHESRVASAQVKSSLLLAGLTGGVSVLLTEPSRSRDHTERMLRAVGVPVATRSVSGGWRVELHTPPSELDPLDLRVPGDFSSAAFLLVLGVLGGVRGGIGTSGTAAAAGRELVVREVGLNPTRTGLLEILDRMGAEVEVRESTAGAPGEEPVGDLRVEPRPLQGIEIGGERLAAFLDEVPILAVAAARASGLTRITGAEELRVKETDRLEALAENLREVGVGAEELPDGLEIEGTSRPLRGRVRSFGDHRIAMAFGVLGALPGNAIEVDDPEIVEVSFPGFWRTLEELAGNPGREERVGKARTRPEEEGSAPPDRPSPEDPPGGPVITVDGPAGSGKSSTAREVARRLELRHLDSGGLYRALTHALLEEGIPPERWEELSPEDLKRIPLRWRADRDGGELRIVLGDRPLDQELRSERVTRHVSRVAGLPAVRARLLPLQREVGRRGGVVADGRDMGTVVFPDADLKIYLTADLEERARRRHLEREGRDPSPEELRAEKDRIRDRDHRDSHRTHSPLKKPEDAFVLDTTDLTFEEQVTRIMGRVRTLTRP